MGRRKLKLSVSRKNEERKKWEFYVVRIPLRAISVFPVSIPLSFPISLPLKVYKEASAPSISVLRDRILSRSSLSQGIYIIVDYVMDFNQQLFSSGWDCKLLTGEVVFCKPETVEPRFPVRLTIQESFHWQLFCHHLQIKPELCAPLQTLPRVLTSISDIEKAILLVSSLKVCVGNPEHMFHSLLKGHKGDSSSESILYTPKPSSNCTCCTSHHCWLVNKCVLNSKAATWACNSNLHTVVGAMATSLILDAYLYSSCLFHLTDTEAAVSSLLGVSTTRHPECGLLIEYSQTRCSWCTKLRKKLQAYLSR